MSKTPPPFSEGLRAKLSLFADLRKPIQMGAITFDSPLLLAPMAGICNSPYRLLMEDLGAGGTVSELVSCHGINYKNERTVDMLKLHPLEKNIGLQLFGEDPHAMAEAAQVAESFGPKFIDINMGCPVNKVVTKGGGSALMKDPRKLDEFFTTIRKKLKIPLSIKIRTGWDSETRNALEVLSIAKNAGIEWVAIHGRTRAQQYTGLADWDFIENLSGQHILPMIGNGDLHHPILVSDRLQKTNCTALMLARGALRNPFIFLESLDPAYANKKQSSFIGADYLEVINRLLFYSQDVFTDERMIVVQMRKLIVWFAAGFPHAAAFRGQIFATNTIEECMQLSQDYFLSLENRGKNINYEESFMSSGHG